MFEKLKGSIASLLRDIALITAELKTKVAKSSVNGGLKIDDKEVIVYEHPLGSGNKHIPDGGNIGQVLTNVAGGTGMWSDNTDSFELANNLGVTEEGRALDAMQGKILNDKIVVLEETSGAAGLTGDIDINDVRIVDGKKVVIDEKGIDSGYRVGDITTANVKGVEVNDTTIKGGTMAEVVMDETNTIAGTATVVNDGVFSGGVYKTWGPAVEQGTEMGKQGFKCFHNEKPIGSFSATSESEGGTVNAFMIASLNEYVLKFVSAGNMSITAAAGKTIYMGNTMFTGGVVDKNGNTVGTGNLTALNYYQNGFMVNGVHKFKWVDGGIQKLNGDKKFIPIKNIATPIPET